MQKVHNFLSSIQFKTNLNNDNKTFSFKNVAYFFEDL